MKAAENSVLMNTCSLSCVCVCGWVGGVHASMYVHQNVWVQMHVCADCICVCVHVEARGSCQCLPPPFPPYMSRQGLSPFDAASLARQGSSLCLPGTGISGGHPSDLPGASVGSGDLNSSPHACLTTVFPPYLLSHCPLQLSGSLICILTGLELAS